MKFLLDNAGEGHGGESRMKDFARTQIDSHKLTDLIAHFSDTQFGRGW